MSGIVQQKSGVATGTSISVTFDNPVVKGNLLIAAMHTTSTNPSSVSDGANTYSPALEQNPAATHLFNMYFASAGANGSITITVNLGGSDTVHLHIFEVTGGYDSTEQSGANYNASNSLDGTVSTDGATTHANSFVLAMFADNFGSGVTWTPGSGFTAGQTTSSGHVVFSEGREVTSTGVQTATASQNFSSVIASGIATFYASGNSGGSGGSGGGGTSTVFLGSVVEVASDTDDNGEFIGTLTVITQAPSGAHNPYLGKVKVVTAPVGRSNPSLGQVVVVAFAPANDRNPFLGQVATS